MYASVLTKNNWHPLLDLHVGHFFNDIPGEKDKIQKNPACLSHLVLCKVKRNSRLSSTQSVFRKWSFRRAQPFSWMPIQFYTLGKGWGAFNLSHHCTCTCIPFTEVSLFSSRVCSHRFPQWVLGHPSLVTARLILPGKRPSTKDWASQCFSKSAKSISWVSSPTYVRFILYLQMYVLCIC